VRAATCSCVMRESELSNSSDRPPRNSPAVIAAHVHNGSTAMEWAGGAKAAAGSACAVGAAAIVVAAAPAPCWP